MKAHKIFFTIVAVPRIAALFVGKTYLVEHEVVIEQARNEVLDNLKEQLES